MLKKLIILFSFALGFAIPVSTSVMDIAAVGLLVLCVLDSECRENLINSVKEPFIKGALLVYLVFLIGVIWSDAPTKDIIHMLVKMDLFLIVPFYFAVFYNTSYKKSVIYGFVSATCIAVFLSLTAEFLHLGFTQRLGIFFDLFGHRLHLFRGHTYQNYFNAVTVIILGALFLYGDISKKQKILALITITVISLDILFIENGRTAQLLYVLMLVMLFIFWRARLGLVLSAILFFVLIPLAFMFSTNIQKEVRSATNEITRYDQGDIENSSIGYRILFHKVSVELIKSSPLIGYGTGSYPSEYAKLNTQIPSINPHNDYLWFGVELGMLGMGVLVIFILACLYQSYLSMVPYNYLGAILLVTYVVSCVENSFFTDRITLQAFMVFASCIFANTRKNFN